jgi:hypothetical protein
MLASGVKGLIFWAMECFDLIIYLCGLVCPLTYCRVSVDPISNPVGTIHYTPREVSLRLSVLS